MFHMCKSAILKSPSAANAGQETEINSYYGMSSGANAATGANDYCESDDDRSKRKYMDKYEKQQPSRNNTVSSRKNNANSNNLCLLLSIEKAHLKAFVFRQRQLRLIRELKRRRQLNRLQIAPLNMESSMYGRIISIFVLLVQRLPRTNLRFVFSFNYPF